MTERPLCLSFPFSNHHLHDMDHGLVLATREEIILPPDVVPDFVRANHTGMYAFLIPAVLLLYDARKSKISLLVRGLFDIYEMCLFNSLYPR